MAIYVKKESAIADTIQTPGDVGNDLDQIEKDIAGPKGISAHEEEIEDAISGVIDDPAKGLMDGSEIAEASYMAMYESENNFNQIIECLDIHTLGAASVGRELVLEAGDIKGFFTKVKDAVIAAFKSFTEVINNLINKVKSIFVDNKKFVGINRNAIVKGFDKMAHHNEEIQGVPYKHEAINDFAEGIKKLAQIGEKIDLDEANIKNLSADKGSDDADAKFDVVRKEMISCICDADGVTSVGDCMRAIEAEMCGTEKVDLRKHYKSGDEFCTILTSETGKEIQNYYTTVKQSIDGRLKKIDEAARKAPTDGTTNAEGYAAKDFKFLASAIKFLQQAMQQSVALVCRIRTNEIMQARKYANYCIKASGDVYKESADVSSNEDSVFAAINLI